MIHAIMILIFAFIFGVSVISLVQPPAAEQREHDTPIATRCTDISTADLADYTPAHEREEHLLDETVHTFAVTLRCRGLVNGHFVDWTADQAMIRRRQ